MRPVSPQPGSRTLGELLQQRLREMERSPEELADAADLPADYVLSLIAGHRRPPLPGRTDLYDRMTRFLRLGRNDLAACARAQRSAPGSPAAQPSARIRRLLLQSCEPGTARELERCARREDGEVARVFERLLGVAQGAARRGLEDQVALRIAATANGTDYRMLRLRVLEFLDATPDTLTVNDFADFVQPRIAQWDVDLETGVLRVVLKPQVPARPSRRRPATRSYPAA